MSIAKIAIVATIGVTSVAVNYYIQRKKAKDLEASIKATSAMHKKAMDDEVEAMTAMFAKADDVSRQFRANGRASR